MTRVLAIAAVLMGLVAVASAQASSADVSIASFNPEDATAPVSGVEGPGIKIGEGTVLHPVLGLETGYLSNVFYEDGAPTGAGMLRLLAQIGTASLSPERLVSPGGGEENEGSLQYRASVRASYDFLLSGNDAVAATGGLGLGALFKGIANPQGRWSFGFDEDFNRLIRAANFESDTNTNRDINNLRLTLQYHPDDSTLGGYLYYANMIDVFERNTQSFADRLENTLGLHPTWKVLPQTTIYGDFSIGFNSGIGSDSQKVNSYPLRLEGGIATLLNIATTLNLHAGYANGFYSSGPNYSSPVVGAALGYRYSPLGRVLLTYDYLHEDSINANFYRDHVIRLWWQQVVAPFSIMVQPEVHFREYQGITAVQGPATRNDTIFSIIAGVHYNFRNSFAATLDYRFTDVDTNYMYMVGNATDNPGYVRHEVLLGVRWAL